VFLQSRLAFFVSALLVTALSVSAQTPSASPAATITPIPLDAWLTSKSLWETTSVYFPQARELGFRWVSEYHDAARASSHALRLLDLPVAEVIVRFTTS